MYVKLAWDINVEIYHLDESDVEGWSATVRQETKEFE